jgi:hypothetical protein
MSVQLLARDVAALFQHLRRGRVAWASSTNEGDGATKC